MRLIALLLALWAGLTFIPSYFARGLSFDFLNWPFSYWMAAYGAPLAYLIIIAVYAGVMNRADRRAELEGTADAVFQRGHPQEFSLRLRRIYVLYTAGFALLILLMALAEILGMPRNWIGYVFLLVTVSLYAGIGIVCRTSDQVEYYVAGRRVPAIYNGMATAADWMSVASFIGVAGTLYLTGYGGLAYIMGWTGGYVLVAMLLAPYLRRFGQYTIPDFMGARYGGNLPRLAGVACAILCSFTYLVAQIYGVGIITTRMTGISFELGIFVALGGMLVCSFLGGMRAVTWTQVGQYIILVIAYLVPVVWLSVKHRIAGAAGLGRHRVAAGGREGKLSAERHRRDRGAAHLAGAGRRDGPAHRRAARVLDAGEGQAAQPAGPAQRHRRAHGGDPFAGA